MYGSATAFRLFISPNDHPQNDGCAEAFVQMHVDSTDLSDMEAALRRLPAGPTVFISPFLCVRAELEYQPPRLLRAAMGSSDSSKNDHQKPILLLRAYPLDTSGWFLSRIRR